MAVTTPPTKFWIVCREDTALTQKLTKEINDWRLPGVRARIGHDMSLSAAGAIAEADHAIFISLCDFPCGQIQINPVSTAPTHSLKAQALQSPVSLLSTLRKRHGKVPNSWWFQLPTTEIRQQGIKPVPEAYALSQTLNKIELFVRNYHTRYQNRLGQRGLGAIASQPIYPAKAALSSPMQPAEKVLQTA
ncbi:MAG: hypothetical protein ACFB16_17845 [Phormidesmis sp.]